ncbi:restriction endonuclease subunit S [Thiocystis violacea]|uniref:restriction endonuclease subunit S n=1 Tax=Thiocystis violacea TaxID=13725 RepID=UPI0019080F6D|nr:restriction endonuclease subunit S [Thiocystis violacea]MBK1724146.1 hypothetical protein [Thiocystis violacea]
MGEWMPVTLGDVVYVQGGFAFKSRDFTTDGIPVLKIKNVREREVDVTEVAFVDQKVADRASNYFCNYGDVLISMTGSGPQAPSSVVGRVARFTGPCNHYLVNQRVGRFQITKPNTLDQRFLFFLLTQPGLQDELVSSATGSANQANISGAQIGKLSVLIPPLSTQKAIASLLGALDDKIELNRQTNETLEALARAIFKDWFVDFGPTRAKAEGREPYLAPDLWDLFPDALDDEDKPVGWETGTVGECFHLTMGQSPPGSTYNDDGDGLPFFQGRTDFGFRYPENRKYCSVPTRIAQPDDTLVSVRAPVGDINMAREKCCIGRGVAALRHKSSSVSFTYYSAWAIQQELQQYEHTGTVFGAINKKQFEALKTIEPVPEMVHVFEEYVGPLDQRIRESVSETRTLAQTRDLLLPKLMSGDIRLREAEKLVEAVA